MDLSQNLGSYALNTEETRHNAEEGAFFGPNTSLFGVQDFYRYRTLIEQATERLAHTLATRQQPSSGITPKQSLEAFRAIDLDQPLGDFSKVLDELDEVYLRHAILFHHPDYVAHLNCPVLSVSLAAEQIATAINTAVETWDQSAGGTWIEQSIVNWFCARVGYPDSGDGVFTTGGTQSNLMALLLAREGANQRFSAQGGRDIPHEKLGQYRILCSADSHFSIQKAAKLLGLGMDAVIRIPYDREHRMDTRLLSQKLAELTELDLLPIAVVATAGTTDFGAIDPLPEIAELCRQYACYLHVDAAYGGALLLSPTHRQRLAGIWQADSVSFDFHKFAFQPVCCSALLVKDRRSLNALTYYADYLNPMEAAEAGTPDLVNKSLQTTRRLDALKLWVTLRAAGPEALGKMFDSLLATTRQVAERMALMPDIQLAQAPSLSTLVFRYSNPALDEPQLDECNRKIRAHLAQSGRAMVAATKIQGRQYLKFTLLNPHTPVSSIEALLQDIRTLGAQETATHHRV